MQKNNINLEISDEINSAKNNLNLEKLPYQYDCCETSETSDISCQTTNLVKNLEINTVLSHYHDGFGVNYENRYFNKKKGCAMKRHIYCQVPNVVQDNRYRNIERSDRKPVNSLDEDKKNLPEKIECCLINMKEVDSDFMQNKEALPSGYSTKQKIYRCRYCNCFRIQKKKEFVENKFLKFWTIYFTFLIDLFCRLKVFGREICQCNFLFNYNYIYFIISMIAGLGFHYLDIYSDIVVLMDLFNTDIIHFYVCLGIIILSTTFNFVNHLIVASGEKSEPVETGACNNISILSFITGFLQLGILNETYHSIRLGKKTRGYVYSRIFESMIESLPQCLFQLYIFLKNIDSFSNNQLYTYSFSILISIMSVTFSIVSYEIFLSDFRPNYQESRGLTPYIIYAMERGPIIEKTQPNLKNDEIRNIVYKDWSNLSESNRNKYEEKFASIKSFYNRRIKLFSLYGILLIVYRFTEVIARMGLIALFSIAIGSGWGVGYILTFDYLAILLSKKIYYSYYSSDAYIRDNFTYCKKCNNNGDLLRIVVQIMSEQMAALNELGVRWYPFYGNLEAIFDVARTENQRQIYRHWYIKFIEGIVMIIFVVNSFIINDNFENKIYYILSILTIVCFIIQNIMIKFLFNQKGCSENLYKSCF